MKQNGKLAVVAAFLAIVTLVAGLSLIVSSGWSSAPETPPEVPELKLEAGMTVGDLGRRHGIEKPILKEMFGLGSPDDLARPVESFGMGRGELQERLATAMALAAEESSKNWVKIALKFALWFLFLGLALRLLLKKAITPTRRRWLYGAAVVLFGVILGSDPGPMGTIKDAIVLYGERGVIFPPRMIALGAFLATVLAANKFICSWGCQAGALQDLIFRINRDGTDRKGRWAQVKVPFAISNTVRVLFFATFTIVAFAWGSDIVHPIDPFRIYKPASLTLTGGVFVGALLVASLFVYRPWCHLFCPFGLVGWVLEKAALLRIHVDYDKCIACRACTKACPSTVMETILERKRVVADCFSCATCIGACPVDAIRFRSGKRALPPPGKFEGKDEASG